VFDYRHDFNQVR